MENHLVDIISTSVVIGVSPGETLWAVDLGGGSSIGGMEMGCASDGERIYMSNQNGGTNQVLQTLMLMASFITGLG